MNYSLTVFQCENGFQWPQEKPCPKAYASLERVIEIQSKEHNQNSVHIKHHRIFKALFLLLSLSSGKHWHCLQSLSQTSGHSPLAGSPEALGQSEREEAETVSAMASLSVDVDQPVSVPENSESSRLVVSVTIIFF